MSLGFVIVRHVNSTETNEYWQEAYRCLRKFYDDPILIVDDNSNSEFLTERDDLINCQIVKGEFPARGEMLGYYYFHKLHPFDKAIVIHDSVFFNRKIDFSSVKEIMFLWSFYHHWDLDADNLELLTKFADSSPLKEKYLDKDSWVGCFGVMSCITWSFLDQINIRHKFFEVAIANVNTRPGRMLIERIFAVICYLNSSTLLERSPHVLGNIYNYCKWGLTFAEYKRRYGVNLPVIKVWTGR